MSDNYSRSAVGIICEYNPFHSGHAFQIEETKRTVGLSSPVVCVMSGNYVQRGENAFFFKEARVRAALKGGADLVLELPSVWAMSSAEHFASAGVGILKECGVVSRISFGAETADSGRLSEIASVLSSPCLEEKMKELMKGGISYGNARTYAAESILGAECPELRNPNNLLGIEYLRAACRLNADLSPVCIKRKGSGHDSEEGDGLSASYIRKALKKGETPSGLLPSEFSDVFSEEFEKGRAPFNADALDTAILSRLRLMKADSIRNAPDVSEGLENKLLSAIYKASSVEEIVSLCSGRRYTAARIRRIVFSLALGITKADAALPLSYIRILGANENGIALLREMDKVSSLPIISKSSHIKALGPEANRIFELECAGTDLLSLACPNREERSSGREWRFSPIIIKEKK